jgi:hypothetical protein
MASLYEKREVDPHVREEHADDPRPKDPIGRLRGTVGYASRISDDRRDAAQPDQHHDDGEDAQKACAPVGSATYSALEAEQQVGQGHVLDLQMGVGAGSRSPALVAALVALQLTGEGG